MTIRRESRDFPCSILKFFYDTRYVYIFQQNIIRKKCSSYSNHRHLLIENSSQNPLKSSNSPIKFRKLISNHPGNKKSRAAPPHPSKLLSIRRAQQKHHAKTLSAIWFILPEPIETSSRRSRGRSSATGIART